MGRAVENYFVQLYGIKEMIAQCTILTASEEREQMADKALEKLGRRCAASMLPVTQREEVEEESDEE